MDFIDEVRTRSWRFAKQIDHLETEEATKSSLVLPFIEMLDYAIFDPTEVVPEFTADVGTKKGEKVDYALIQDGRPAILIECKKYGSNLDSDQMSQLLRYFTVTDARIGVLTDGIRYLFFSDLDKPNVMDPKPFFEFNMLDFTEAQVAELERFTKSAFDLHEIVDAARELKYTTEIKRILAEEWANPSDEFVRFLIGRVYRGRITQTVKEQFGSLTQQALSHFVNDRIDTLLKSALEREDGQASKVVEDNALDEREHGDESDFVPLELDALQIVKAIIRDLVDVHRVGLRLSKTYCSVLLDDNNRKVVCRLRLRTANLRLGLLGEDRREERVSLNDLDDLFSHAESLRSAVASLNAGPVEAPEDEESDTELPLP